VSNKPICILTNTQFTIFSETYLQVSDNSKEAQVSDLHLTNVQGPITLPATLAKDLQWQEYQAESIGPRKRVIR
jgi:hypothetical protein